jgi:hypothetical protein
LDLDIKILKTKKLPVAGVLVWLKSLYGSGAERGIDEFVFVYLYSGYQMGGVAGTDKAKLYFGWNEGVGEESRF